jgi:predicted dinucleotide-binding enzyme
MSESPAAPKLYDSAKEIVVSVFPSSATLSAIRSIAARKLPPNKKTIFICGDF